MFTEQEQKYKHYTTVEHSFATLLKKLQSVKLKSLL